MNRLILLGMIAIFLTGCESFQQLTNSDGMSREDHRRQQIQQYNDQCLGNSEDDLVMKLGAPSSIENAGSFKIYSYYKDFGTTSSAVAYDGIANGRSTHHFHESRFYFKDGAVVKWDYDGR